jgi:hypothetical protein
MRIGISFEPGILFPMVWNHLRERKPRLFDILLIAN